MTTGIPTIRPLFFRRYGLAILAGAGLLLPVGYWGSVQALRSNRNDFRSWLPAAYEETATLKWYRKHFESDAFILASWDGCTLESPELPRLAARLRGDGEAVQKSGGLSFFTDVTTGGELLNMLTSDQGLSREAALARLRGSVIGPDGEQTCLLATVSFAALQRWDTPGQASEHATREFLHAAVNAIYEAAEKECGIARDELHLGGPPVVNVAIDIEGERSMIKLAAACGVLALVLSWWTLRSWKLTVTVLTTALLSAGVSLALVWYTGTAMNAILLTMPALVFVAAASGAIHLANYYRDASAQGDIHGAADRALAHAWIPLGLATGTTGIGLLSLAVSELNPIRMFGMYSALGVAVAFAMLCTYMPSMLAMWPQAARRKAEAAAACDHRSPARWQAAGYWIVRHGRWVTLGCLAVMAVGLYGLSKVETSVDLMRLFSSRAPIIQDYTWLQNRLGPLVPMEIVLRVDQEKSRLGLLDQMRLVEKVQRAVEQTDHVGSALAAPTFAPPIPAKIGTMRRATWNSLLERHQDRLRDYWSEEGGEQLWRISARVDALNDIDYDKFVSNLRNAVEPVLESYPDGGANGVSATYTGLVPLIDKAQRSLLDGLMLGFAGDLVLIGVAIVVLMRNWSASLLLMLPSLFPLVIVFGVMGLLGIRVDTGTVMAPAVALGVTVDDAIHFMLWCRRGEDQGMDRTESLMFAYKDCAQAIFQSWAVIGLGLSAFALSSFIPTRRFGILMLTLLTISSIANLVFLPALLAGPWGRWFWRARKETAEAKFPGRLAPAGLPKERSHPIEPQIAGLVVPPELERTSVSRSRSAADDVTTAHSARRYIERRWEA